jgi:hypothetical protein
VLASVGLSSYGFTYDNWGANPSLTAQGTSVIPGASNAEGTFTQIASGANISRDVYWIAIWVNGGSTSAQQKDHLLDIGVDPAGGSSYTAVISDIVCGESIALNSGVSTLVGASRHFVFPLFIKNGSSVAVRIQGSNATAGTVRVSAKFWGDPSNPECVPVGQYSETIGAISGSAGVVFTPGNAADGTYTSLGTTTRDLWWWQLGVSVSDATMSFTGCYVDLAYGDATNKVIIRRGFYGTDGSEMLAECFGTNLLFDSYKPVPAGATLYVRGRCSTTPDSNWNAVAIGIGG